ncbi:hypothetical protein LH460_03165 [Laribacter hongkongensis]|uniref:hypothetical protein n=1 Tax=Laribacter hongkongensis TaxID=168471 RepID=UPI001EFD8D3A|nr:hypothetical protein [Laribacter hongkongensis]MCG9123683.1 hypothetical protein [Laribacter hongkongensis]
MKVWTGNPGMMSLNAVGMDRNTGIHTQRNAWSIPRCINTWIEASMATKMIRPVMESLDQGEKASGSRFLIIGYDESNENDIFRPENDALCRGGMADSTDDVCLRHTSSARTGIRIPSAGKGAGGNHAQQGRPGLAEWSG